MPERTLSIDTPTSRLRFVERDSKRILQQRWAVRTYLETTGAILGEYGEWRDVPLRPEDDPEDRQ